MKHRHFVTAFIVMAMSGAGCSGFRSQWRAANAERPPRWSTIAGPWEGTWTSAANGHSGALRCVVGSEAARVRGRAPVTVPFHYRATWLGVLKGSFRTTQPVRAVSRERFVSEGTWTLPTWAGGAYWYRLEATPTEVQASYRSASDHGRFQLTRPNDGNRPRERAAR